jgi:hypothetical protein
MMDEKIKVLKVKGIGNFKANFGNDEGYTNEIQGIIDWIDDLGYSYGSVLKKHKNEGKWSVMVDGNKLAYIVLTKDTYADRLIGNLLHDCEVICSKLVQGYSGEVDCKKSLKQIKDKYCNPEDFDQLTSANNKVEQVQIQLNDNINNLAMNQGNLEVAFFSGNSKIRGWKKMQRRSTRPHSSLARKVGIWKSLCGGGSVN